MQFAHQTCLGPRLVVVRQACSAVAGTPTGGLDLCLRVSLLACVGVATA
jgi:hypothetical protein